LKEKIFIISGIRKFIAAFLCRYLDISHDDEDEIALTYKDPEQTLHQLMKSLPNLTSLDISGTNLGGLQSTEHSSHRLLPQGDKSPLPCLRV
jgi:hypothetical protein